MPIETPTKTCKKSIKYPPGTAVCIDCGPPKNPCPQDVVLNCCTGAGLNPIPVSSDTPPELPVSLVCAALDTTCLCKPVVSVEFNCIVNTDLFAFAEILLTFQLKKSCDNGQDVVCGSWTMRRDNNFVINNDSFKFAFCDTTPCSGCCTYAVELISADLPQGFVILGIHAPTIKTVAAEACADRKADCFHAVSPCAHCVPTHPCPQGVIFNCCTGASIQNTSVCPAVPRSLVSVAIDTTCLCKPLVVLDFGAIIAATVPPGIPVPIALVFQVKKSCVNGQEIDCGTWSFLTATNTTLTTSDSFRFTFCDCSPCPACCTYCVELVSCITSEGTPFAGNFSINAPTASVLAVDTCPQPLSL